VRIRRLSTVPGSSWRLAAGEMHLWEIDLGTCGAVEETLSRSELERARKFHCERDRARFVTTRAAIREILAAYVGVESSALPLAVSDAGKPCLATAPIDSPNLTFNLSHSGDWAVLGISRNAEVGVDLEIGAQVLDRTSMLAALTPRELDVASALDDVALHAAFRVAWTRKEACLKAAGIGFAIDPSEVEAGLEPVPGIVELPNAAMSCSGRRPLSVHILTLPRSRVGTVSLARVGTPITTMRTFQFTMSRYHNRPPRHTINPSNKLGAFKCVESLQS